MKIVNDPDILRATPILIEEGSMPHRVVLRRLSDSYQPFVTHYENMRAEDEGNTWVHRDYYWGHYFNTLEEALKDFEERCRGKGL